MTLRTDNPDSSRQGDSSRLNLLLSYSRGGDEAVMEQLPRLLTPLGIRSIRTSTAEHAAEAISSDLIHIAVVDLAIPLNEGTAHRAAGGRVLQLLRRLEQPPPTVVVRPPQPTSRDSARGLTEALREGAFTVLDRPLGIEQVLDVMRRILRRHYADVWPNTTT